MKTESTVDQGLGEVLVVGLHIKSTVCNSKKNQKDKPECTKTVTLAL